MSRLLQEHDPSVRIQQKCNQSSKFNNSYAQAVYLSSLSVSRVQLSILYMVQVIGRMAGKPVLQTPRCSVSGGGVQGFDRWNIRRNPCTAPAGPYFSERRITKYLFVREGRPPEHIYSVYISCNMQLTSWRDFS